MVWITNGQFCTIPRADTILIHSLRFPDPKRAMKGMSFQKVRFPPSKTWHLPNIVKNWKRKYSLLENPIMFKRKMRANRTLVCYVCHYYSFSASIILSFWFPVWAGLYQMFGQLCLCLSMLGTLFILKAIYFRRTVGLFPLVQPTRPTHTEPHQGRAA